MNLANSCRFNLMSSVLKSVPEVVPERVTDAGLAALADAQEPRGPTSAGDRVHTGLQDFLKAACDEEGITYPSDLSS